METVCALLPSYQLSVFVNGSNYIFSYNDVLRTSDTANSLKKTMPMKSGLKVSSIWIQDIVFYNLYDAIETENQGQLSI